MILDTSNRRAGASLGPFRGPGPVALALAAAGAMAAPTTAWPAQTILISLCGVGFHPLELPNLPDSPDPKRHCDKACHAFGRKRLVVRE